MRGKDARASHGADGFAISGRGRGRIEEGGIHGRRHAMITYDVEIMEESYRR